MRASKVQRSTLQFAAQEIGVHAEINGIGRQFRVKLLPQTRPEMHRPMCKRCRDFGRTSCHCRRWADDRGDAKYQREGIFRQQRIHAVCWHGFRDFFRAVYRIEPAATFRTAMATWKGSEHFGANFAETGYRNIGSQMCPMSAAEACRCPETGLVDRHIVTSFDTYGADEADGAACRAMANALRAVRT